MSSAENSAAAAPPIGGALERVVNGEPGAREALGELLTQRGWVVDLTGDGPVPPARLLSALIAAPQWDEDDKLRVLADLAEHALDAYFQPVCPEDTRPREVLQTLRRYLDGEDDINALIIALDEAEDSFLDLGRVIEASPDGEGVVVRYRCTHAGCALHAMWCFADLGRIGYEASLLVREQVRHVAEAAEAACSEGPGAARAAARQAELDLLGVAATWLERGPRS